MVTMKVMNLRSQETVTGRKSFIVIGSSTAHGEELTSRGKVFIIAYLLKLLNYTCRLSSTILLKLSQSQTNL